MKPAGIVVGLLLVGLVGHAAAAETYRYVPTLFYNPAAGGAVVLRIKSGDRVITSTVDDLGAGADLKGTTEGGPPQTGPFFIEGAEPGDLLVVTIEKLMPNRSTGYSTSLMSDHAIARGGLEGKPDPARLPWTIDTAAGVVRLDLQQIVPNTDWKSRFSSSVFTLPLRPTLAAIGVARAAGTTGAAGPFGGEMSGGVTAGSRVMLPVSQIGALLYLGHGHARQGDGQITGTVMDLSSVSLRPGSDTSADSSRSRCANARFIRGNGNVYAIVGGTCAPQIFRAPVRPANFAARDAWRSGTAPAP